jgi:hypothetical protein
MTAPTPSPAVVELDGWSLEPLQPEDAPLVLELVAQRGHRYIFDVAPDEKAIAAVLADLPRQPWTLPLMMVKDDSCAGMATTALPNFKSLHSSVVALFVDPAASVLPLAMYLRHVFWNFPLRRLHAQIPVMDLTREYVELLCAVGFKDEGRLVNHTIIAGQQFDMAALGLLRADFEEWCATNEPRLSLSS